MYTSLRLRLRDPLYTMHTTLILERAVDACTRYIEDDLLVATRTALCVATDGDTPPLRLAVARVHTEEVTRKERCLVTTRTSA